MFIRLKYNSTAVPHLHGNDVNVAVDKITVFATAGSDDPQETVTGSIISMEDGNQIAVQESPRVIRSLIEKAGE